MSIVEADQAGLKLLPTRAEVSRSKTYVLQRSVLAWFIVHPESMRKSGAHGRSRAAAIRHEQQVGEIHHNAAYEFGRQTRLILDGQLRGQPRLAEPLKWVDVDAEGSDETKIVDGHTAHGLSCEPRGDIDDALVEQFKHVCSMAYGLVMPPLWTARCVGVQVRHEIAYRATCDWRPDAVHALHALAPASA